MRERPRGAKELQRALQRYAIETGQPAQRVMHLVRTGVVCAMLDAVRHEDGRHEFIVKGGTAMQIRLGIQARATTDLDMIFRGHVDDWLRRFDQATVGKAWNGFAVERKRPPEQIEVHGVGYRPWRVPLQLRYEGREFGTTSLEVAIDEQTGDHHDEVAADPATFIEFGFDPPAGIPCLSIPYQIAQKLHACTEPIEGGNPRSRDVVDLQLLEPLLDSAGRDETRSALRVTFARRRGHAWPPALSPHHFRTNGADEPGPSPASYLLELIERVSKPT